jgi:hypothetical protein
MLYRAATIDTMMNSSLTVSIKQLRSGVDENRLHLYA